MAISKKKRVFTKKQEIYDRPRRMFTGTYTTKSGEVKNRYMIDPEAKVIKTITHRNFHKRIK